MRPRLTLSPSRLRIAGSSVSAAATDAIPTRIAPRGEAAHDRRLHEQQPGHREHERTAAEQDRAARRRSGHGDRVELLEPSRALLAEARDDEQGIVDPEREAHAA
jgi:hypothetical protein